MAYRSKIYANALAKYNETQLLGDDKIRRLIEADFATAVKILIDNGYGGGNISEESYDIDVFLTQETARLVSFVNEECPSEELKKCLINKFYFSDAIVYYKAKFVDFDKKSALYGIFSELETAVKTANYQELDPFLADAYTALDTLFTDSAPNPKLIDLYITKAMFQSNLNAAKRSHSRQLTNFVKTELDFANIMTAARIKSLNLSPENFEKEQIKGGTLTGEQFAQFFNKSPEQASQSFENTKYEETVSALVLSGDFALFEKNSDEYLYNILNSDSENMQSFSPFINYFLRTTSEFKTVKTILVCLKNNARDEILRRIKTLND